MPTKENLLFISLCYLGVVLYMLLQAHFFFAVALVLFYVLIAFVFFYLDKNKKA
ncbi:MULTISPECIES: hypothetical protein [unclassified Campylobacter]|uniref:hypothetical protein n=1 Tax=unclassified Campylobacter TaxID=2593542 RepID=UPI0013898AC4|nr:MULTISPECIES: hypothetical protein [unclassified Campylobacter]NDJ26837.1 hypothetical protein [Campylobacter sp. MIT 19-121]